MRTLVRLLPLAFLCACAISDDTVPSPPGDVDVGTLLAAPGEIEVDGRRLILEGIAWRDFMPGPVEPESRGLIAIGRVEDPGQVPIPAELEIEKLWVVQGDEVWSPSELERPPSAYEWQLQGVAHDGPRWDPDSIVHVVVRLGADDRTWWLHDETRIFTTW